MNTERFEALMGELIEVNQAIDLLKMQKNEKHNIPLLGMRNKQIQCQHHLIKAIYTVTYL
jgi:hypothetical protein